MTLGQCGEAVGMCRQQVKNKGVRMLLTEKEHNAGWTEHFQEVSNQAELMCELDLDNDVPNEQLQFNMTDIIVAEVTQVINSLTNKYGVSTRYSQRCLNNTYSKNIVTEQLVVYLTVLGGEWS